MKRKLFTLAAALSTLISLATTVMWVRSNWRADRWAREVNYAYRKGSVWGAEPRLTSASGEVYIEWVRNVSDRRPPLGAEAMRWLFSTMPPDELWSLIMEPLDIIPDSGPVDESDPAWIPVNSASGWSYRGFGWSRFADDLKRTEHLRTYAVAVPYWFLAAAFAVLPVVHVYRNRRRKAPSGTQCRSCGYDLRGTPDRCPECGTPARCPA